MESLTSIVGRKLIWSPSRSTKRTYELGMDGQILATLYQPSIWRQERLGVTASGRWRFARIGVFRQRLVISDADTGAEVAQMARSAWTRSGTLTLSDGKQYQWRSGSFWGTKWVWLDAAEQPLLHFRQFGALRLQCTVTVEPQAASDPHLALLMTLGWYLMLLMREETAAGVATTAGASH